MKLISLSRFHSLLTSYSLMVVMREFSTHYERLRVLRHFLPLEREDDKTDQIIP